MRTVLVKKDELVRTLTENRSKHQATYSEARHNHQQRVIDELRRRADEIEAGTKKATDLNFDLPEPEDHTSDYDDVLRALELHQGDEIELDRLTEFRWWVLDQWQWGRSFLENTTSYTAAGGGR